MLSKGKINVEEQILPVAAALPTGYLAIQPLGLGKGVRHFFYSSPSIKFNLNPLTLLIQFIIIRVHDATDKSN